MCVYRHVPVYNITIFKNNIRKLQFTTCNNNIHIIMHTNLDCVVFLTSNLVNEMSNEI